MNKFSKKLTTALGVAVAAFTFINGTGYAAGSIEFTNSDTINSSYNRTNAVSFIKSYAAKPGYTTSPFTSYGGNSDGGDCTNFVSEVLHLGGGLGFHGTKGNNSNTVDWYYYGPHVPPSTQPRTSSWTGAHQFREHWGVVNGSGGKKAYQMIKYTNKDAVSSYNEIYSSLWNGDIIQYVDATGHTVHSQVVWNFANQTMNVAQHSTNDRYWGLDMGLRTELENRQDQGGHVVLLKIKKSGS
ncbi:amidase domain-containing protein [Paenibacillus chitinolyticus]|uniref:amidase domain-containing protein n=1 Tax=Paenibacillus chitinolyticus TaxID=79263 RepID=UPI001C495580|nr:amidase domain-containing protein [Paenibacillus chitinolyticus]